ncbi:hypothetical protein CO046_03710 [Candidatus Peregrinibacteria bacterium CG_4_9_14_0_2_um_filter_53_11]|nr:MAG: hypothetical protein CO046_03710 [Candidatus Peregrinibacteria bacterium CG_4_9_14_0_2_um_filter_53_11]
MKYHLLFQKSALVLIIALLLTNQAIALRIGGHLMGPGHKKEKMELSNDFSKDIATLVTPVSAPLYASELGLDFSTTENIDASIKKLGLMAPMQGQNPLPLDDEELKRYIAIGTEPTVTCEFCCGVDTLVRKDGSPTCSCAHSIAMRGTAAYLIDNYPEMSNAEISYELMRQKGMYFPSQMQKRMASELAGEASDFTPDIRYLAQNLTESELTTLQKKAKEEGFVPPDTSMVGGC